jgi:nucleoside phosphorylase
VGLIRTTGSARIVVVTAVRAETRAVLAALVQPVRVRTEAAPCWEGWAGTRAVTVVQAGIGPDRARAAVRAVVRGSETVVSIGFAGALVEAAEPGDLVLPGLIVWDADGTVQRYEVSSDVLAIATARMPAALDRRALRGSLWSSPVVVDTPAAKRAAARRLGAVAVEMETAALVADAIERGGRVLAVRAILDTVDVSLEALPSGLDVSWAARARLLGKPKAWPGVVTLARHVPRAARTIARAAAAILPAL